MKSCNTLDISIKLSFACAILFALLTENLHANECVTLRVGGTNGWFPVTYINDETQEIKGIANDFVKVISKRLNIPVMIDVQLPWNRLLKYLETGDIDINSAIYWTEERSKIYLYTDPYFVNEARVFVKKGNEFQFEQLEDLIGLIGGIPTGGSFGEKFDSFALEKQLKLNEVATKDQRVQMLLTGRTDYFIQAHLDGISYINQNGLQDQIVVLPHPVSKTEVYFAISRQSPCAQLLPQINEIIKTSKLDGTLQAIINKYIE